MALSLSTAVRLSFLLILACTSQYAYAVDYYATGALVCPESSPCTGQSVGNIINQGNDGKGSPRPTITSGLTLHCSTSNLPTPTTISKDANGNIIGQVINSGKTYYNCNWTTGSNDMNPTVTTQDGKGSNSAAENAAGSWKSRIMIVGVIVGIWMALM
ncbi:3179_t:CDS:1 [Paraglomus brasilianum]|uniref:3179_t:CDS:1 n=1 Tax=Paraglomus brasilianum TaxID=144538 RepID=A0A9N9G1L2_9GLOM|nr:3179_t:CDS:1 [Paraglomus brasilianum]